MQVQIPAQGAWQTTHVQSVCVTLHQIITL